MKITLAKVKRELIKRGWTILETDYDPNYHELIKDTKEIVEEIINGLKPKK
jgi:hypothetical protein